MSKADKYRLMAQRQVASWSDDNYDLFKGDASYDTDTGTVTYPGVAEVNLPVAVYDVEESSSNSATYVRKKGVIAGLDLGTVNLEKGDALVSSSGRTYIIDAFNTDQYQAAFMLELHEQQ